jgi:N-acyl-L-homoserine lactone synthetase
MGRKRMNNTMIEEIFEADAAGWTVTEIANDLKIPKQEIVNLFLKYERYEPDAPELKT